MPESRSSQDVQDLPYFLGLLIFGQSNTIWGLLRWWCFAPSIGLSVDLAYHMAKWLGISSVGAAVGVICCLFPAPCPGRSGSDGCLVRRGGRAEDEFAFCYRCPCYSLQPVRIKEGARDTAARSMSSSGTAGRSGKEKPYWEILWLLHFLYWFFVFVGLLLVIFMRGRGTGPFLTLMYFCHPAMPSGLKSFWDSKNTHML